MVCEGSRQVVAVQDDEGAHRPREDDVEPVQPPRLGGHDRRRVDHDEGVELQALRQRGRDDRARRTAFGTESWSAALSFRYRKLEVTDLGGARCRPSLGPVILSL
jgi:hypothetical protein